MDCIIKVISINTEINGNAPPIKYKKLALMNHGWGSTYDGTGEKLQGFLIYCLLNPKKLPKNTRGELIPNQRANNSIKYFIFTVPEEFSKRRSKLIKKNTIIPIPG